MNFPIELNPEFLAKAARLKIEPVDIVEQFVRGSGKGGQKVNKTSSTVWLKHLPTGFEVKVQEVRERERNRSIAYKRLILKIEEAVLGRESDRQQENFKLRKQKQRRSKRAKEKMLKAKAHRASIKESRKKSHE